MNCDPVLAAGSGFIFNSRMIMAIFSKAESRFVSLLLPLLLLNYWWSCLILHWWDLWKFLSFFFLSLLHWPLPLSLKHTWLSSVWDRNPPHPQTHIFTHSHTHTHSHPNPSVTFVTLERTLRTWQYKFSNGILYICFGKQFFFFFMACEWTDFYCPEFLLIFL